MSHLSSKERLLRKKKTKNVRNRRWLSHADRRRRRRSRRQRLPNQAHEEKSRPSRRCFAAMLLQLFTVSRLFLHEQSIIKCETKTEEERLSEFVRKCALEPPQQFSSKQFFYTANVSSIPLITSPCSSFIILSLQSLWKWAPGRGSKDPTPSGPSPPFMRAN